MHDQYKMGERKEVMPEIKLAGRDVYKIRVAPCPCVVIHPRGYLHIWTGQVVRKSWRELLVLGTDQPRALLPHDAPHRVADVICTGHALAASRTRRSPRPGTESGRLGWTQIILGI